MNTFCLARALGPGRRGLALPRQRRASGHGMPGGPRGQRTKAAPRQDPRTGGAQGGKEIWEGDETSTAARPGCVRRRPCRVSAAHKNERLALCVRSSAYGPATCRPQEWVDLRTSFPPRLTAANAFRISRVLCPSIDRGPSSRAPPRTSALRPRLPGTIHPLCRPWGSGAKPQVFPLHRSNGQLAGAGTTRNWHQIWALHQELPRQHAVRAWLPLGIA